MKKILSLLLTVFVILGSVSAFAADTNIDRTSGVITISGTAEPDARVMLMVLKEGKTAENLTGLASSDMMTVVEHMDQKRADSEGYFEFVFKNGYGDNFGRFVAMVNTTNEPYVVENLEIKYYTDNTSDALTAQIVSKTNKTEVNGLIDEDTTLILGLDTAFFSQLTDEGKDAVYQVLADMTKGDNEELKSIFYFSSVVEFINASDSFEAMYGEIEKAGISDEVFGFSKTDSLYKGLTDTQSLEERILALIPAKDIESFRKASREAFALEAVKNYKYTFTKKIFTEYNDVLELDLDELGSSTENKVFKAIAGNSYKDAAELRRAFNKALDSSDSSSGSGGGGGGSSSTGGAFKGAGKGGLSGGVAIVVPEATSPVTPAPKKAFSDMESTHFASEAVAFLSDKGVIAGYPDGSFAPDKAVNRMEFVKMMVVAFGIEAGADVDVYTDLKADDWYYSYCTAAIAKGILNGVSETEIGADLPVTRQDVCVLLDRMLKAKGLSLASGSNVDFKDSESVSDYAKDGVSTFAGAGIVSGSDGMFRPLDSASRAECAKIIYKVMMEVVK